MKIPVSSLLAFSTLLCHSTLATTLKPSRKDVLESWDSVQARHLSPAYPHGGLRKRQPGKILRNEANLDFVDHFTHVTARSNDSVLYATLNMRSNHPVLPIEDLEDGLVNVTCSEEGIKLTFSTSQITDITINKDENSVLLSRKDVQWKEAFHRIDVPFSHKRSSSVVRRSQKPVNPSRRRSDTLKPEESPTPTGHDIVFPGVPSNIPYLQDGGGRISVNHKDRKLVPLDSDISNILGLPEGVTLSCKECRITGDVVLSTGSFPITTTDDSGLVSTIAFIREGQVDIELNRIFARMELELALEAGKELLNFTVPMPSVPLSPFTVSGGVLSPCLFEANFFSGVVSKPLNFSYGVDISAPEDSFISLNFGSPANSTIEGLQHTTFTEISFQSPQAITDLTFSVSFTPEILHGMRSPTGIISGGAGVAFNMPQASVKVSQLDDVNEACEKIPHAPGTEDDMTKKGSLFGNFTHVEPSLEFNAVPFIEMQLDLPRREVLRQLEATVTSTQFSLPTACLAFDQKMGTYGAPTQVLATSTSEPTATASEAKKGAAGRTSVANTWTVLCISVLVAAVLNAI
ncbi:hypothetical protein TEQG_07903 [Trichophyton equinum CBS 127.97]|uniref:GPI anchored protein n=1 Tax=Trichophyton equinum (strain ATCC MYA-4606 / CBS 127.97) TaxID=559882 RepID=F2Q480_TRIEC|nr:hypothetical protein TEQG_07903 [Trichophyton equinum CBS 127.97]